MGYDRFLVTLGGGEGFGFFTDVLFSLDLFIDLEAYYC